ncbi:prepilin-type N-terminal cleavage/methylation domain-containing protein [Vibrio fluvialis]|uniref:pilin n=1 Tax=Vibrio fluvialis TaxID=676 RepID=UPI0013028CF1|nr:prepilin-type N-terminal cleavage/methylation domain-containing protein [Vibrio fluvialis]EKO3369495.1 prepilin-type N-terminal cleavage/methylation domain-containing protein [Vibrio fluvialis]EKO3441946.1 prepilin-type N-terminal cleavage/methylation domain-containing protein [Vibrio fluvialis]EKO3467990.1 prepilin-type N-terminal cleavage/methylation domain-containing protein [Vibrio fluvialis]EKO3540278.1 prepilin-type N-terminal cleavage/methylation domain-containing protein [Vibrio fluv
MNANQRKQQQGFTLIELMIVVAIIGVLSAIAVPAYKDYVTKSELASGVATLKSLITPAELYYQEKGTLTSDSDLSNLGIATDSTKSGTLSVVSGAIKLTFASPSGASATITRDNAKGWVCSMALPSGLSSDIKPKSCS